MVVALIVLSIATAVAAKIMLKQPTPCRQTRRRRICA